MNFFPESFNPRDPVVWGLDLVALDTPDGIARFMIGTDGIFTDSLGRPWYGSQLLTLSGMESTINGVAPAGKVGMAFLQDPDGPNVIESLKEYGAAYLDGRPIDFFVQPLAGPHEFSAPTVAPRQWARRIMRTMGKTLTGPLQREIWVGFEAYSEKRRTARRIAMNTEGHAELIGESNPSLEFLPTSEFKGTVWND